MNSIRRILRTIQLARTAGALTLLALPLFMSTCERAPERPNIVLIVLDTVRADHMSCYGYDRDTTPLLSALASSATRYKRARATSPWTLPSHASLFTGLYAYEHGAHTFWVDIPTEEAFPDTNSTSRTGLIDNVRPLPEEWPTLAEVLAAAGYRTAAIGANIIYLDEVYGLDRGFEVYDMVDTDCDSLNDRVEAWLDRNGKEPFFLFMNYMDAHSPYNNSPVPGLFKYDVPPNTTFFMNRLYERLLTPSEPVPGRALQLLRDQYDLGIANLDAGIGRLIEMFRQRGLYEDMLLIITSDHGEYLGERRLIAHSKDVYEPVLDIPLIIKEPRQRKGEVNDTPVSLVHIPRLILKQVNGADNAPFPYNEPGGDIIAENHYSRWKDLLRPWGPRFHRERYVLYRGQLKLIVSTDGENELYDLSQDRDEYNNIIAARGDETTAMRKALRDRILKGREHLPPLQKRTLSDEEQRRLKALGYL